jgi:hypothetical protein
MPHLSLLRDYIVRHGGLDEGLECRGVECFALSDVDGTARVAAEPCVEQSLGIGKFRAVQTMPS